MSTSERPNELGAAVYGGVKKMSRCFGLADSPPCITARRGGRAINKMPRSVRDREAGVVFRLRTKRKTTITLRAVALALRAGWLRYILLMTQPPLLAVMQGGECSAPHIRHFFHSSYD